MKFQQGHPQRACQIEVGVGSNSDFQPISRYVSETVQDRDSYYGMLMGTRMCSIDWCYVQWPWMTLITTNHPIFDILYHLSLSL